MATKKIVSLFLALLMALGLCVTAGAEEGATITVGFWGSSGEDKAIDAALEGVLEAIPGVKEVKKVQYPAPMISTRSCPVSSWPVLLPMWSWPPTNGICS